MLSTAGPALNVLASSKTAVAPSARRLSAALGCDDTSQGPTLPKASKSPQMPTTKAAASIAAALGALE